VARQCCGSGSACCSCCSATERGNVGNVAAASATFSHVCAVQDDDGKRGRLGSARHLKACAAVDVAWSCDYAHTHTHTPTSHCRSAAALPLLTAALFCHRRPTGDDKEEDDTPMSDDERSYYAIQVCVSFSSCVCRAAAVPCTCCACCVRRGACVPTRRRAD
jgi:hypothetical protein